MMFVVSDGSTRIATLTVRMDADSKGHIVAIESRDETRRITDYSAFEYLNLALRDGLTVDAYV